LNKTDKVV